MQFVDLFLQFIEKIFDFEILGFSVFNILIICTFLSIAFSLIHKMIKTKE